MNENAPTRKATPSTPRTKWIKSGFVGHIIILHNVYAKRCSWMSNRPR